jgi:hypothetical protein
VYTTDVFILDEGGAIHPAIRHTQVSRRARRALQTHHGRGGFRHRLGDMREIIADDRVHVRRDALFAPHCAE